MLAPLHPRVQCFSPVNPMTVKSCKIAALALNFLFMYLIFWPSLCIDMIKINQTQLHSQSPAEITLTLVSHLYEASSSCFMTLKLIHNHIYLRLDVNVGYLKCTNYIVLLQWITWLIIVVVLCLQIAFTFTRGTMMLSQHHFLLWQKCYVFISVVV